MDFLLVHGIKIDSCFRPAYGDGNLAVGIHSGMGKGDAVAEIPAELECATFIVVGPADKEGLEICHMLRDSIWNGVTWQDTQFDGNVMRAIDDWADKLKRVYSEKYAETHAIRDDWLCITLDYHS